MKVFEDDNEVEVIKSELPEEKGIDSHCRMNAVIGRAAVQGAFTITQVSREISDVQQTLENDKINKPLDSLHRDVSEEVNKQNPNSNEGNRKARSICTNGPKYDAHFTPEYCNTEYRKNK
ncbi:hypothetical protein HHI36_016647 [Cryptolaemus montrouzieri]|uniref:Uncharacterized protein n=1 Tax=Cryptolaemus montrouzieri TaxID=559131 RepID=A0ABD2NKF9_9CUCU